MPAVRDLLAHLAGARTTGVPPVEMVRAIPPGGTSVDAIAEQFDTSRQAVYRGLDPVEEASVIEADTYRRTGFGEVLLRVLAEATAAPTVDLEAIASLSGAEHRERVLTALDEEPTAKRALASEHDGPSRSSLYRIIDEFEQHGWIEDPPAADGLVRTPAGDEVAAAFATLTTAVDRALLRRPFLRCVDGTVADIPLEGLAAAEQYLHTPADPDPALDRKNGLVAADPASFRGFMSAVSRKKADQGDRLIRSGTETELVITETVLRNLPTQGHYTTHVRRGLDARNFSMAVAPDREELPVDLAIFDGETVALRPPRLEQTLGAEPVGSVIGSDDDLVAWAEQLYEQYHGQAQSPAASVITQLKRAISESVQFGPDEDSEKA